MICNPPSRKSSLRPASYAASKPAFTLVELLVVIGIIALLISILLPALNKAREQANSVKCAANMRSAMQAVLMYVSEGKGWLPGPETSGVVWPRSGTQITLTDTSSDTTPLQNMDWVSPSLGKMFRWPENDYQRLKTIYNLQLNCPTNKVTFSDVYPTGSLPYTPNDLAFSSYSAVLQFEACPSRDRGSATLPPITDNMFPNSILIPPSGYAPNITKVGSASKKVFLVEGSRDIANAVPQVTTFNSIRYQVVGGNFMIGGPFTNWPSTPWAALTSGANQNYTAKVPPSMATTFGWRHNGKMNLAFFDGHVEMRGVADSIQTELYCPKGTTIANGGAKFTYDPKDSDGQTIN